MIPARGKLPLLTFYPDFPCLYEGVNRMNIPEIRERLKQISQERDIPELAELADQLRRRYHGRAARKVSETVTPELELRVRQLHVLFPDLAQHKIGELLNLNSGRVSEILRGKRT